MTSKAPFAALALLLLASLACSFSVGLPSFDGSVRSVGELRSQDLTAPIPQTAVARLDLDFAAGELRLEPGSDSSLVEGTATWNVEELEPTVVINDDGAVIATGEIDGDLNFNFDLYPPNDLRNEWQLSLAPVPMDLNLDGGAYQGRMEFGGLSLRRLDVSSGASDLELSFAEPNQIEMEALNVDTGASSIRLTGLGNARFSQMTFDGGAGDFTLDFGEMLQDGQVSIDAALASLEISVSADSQVEFTIDGALADINMPASFVRSGDRYVQAGSGPTLSIRLTVGAGSVDVISR